MLGCIAGCFALAVSQCHTPFSSPTPDAPFDKQQCTLDLGDASSFFASRVACREHTTDLLMLKGEVEARQTEALPEGVYWLAAQLGGSTTSAASGTWRWGDGAEVDFEHLASLGVNISGSPAQPGRPNSTRGSCLSVSNIGKALEVRAVPCGHVAGHPVRGLCAMAPSCPFTHLDLEFRARFRGLLINMTIHSALSFLSSSIMDLGIGEWVTPTTFRVPDPDGTPCIWLAIFSYDTALGRPTLKTGCEGGPLTPATILFAMCDSPRPSTLPPDPWTAIFIKETRSSGPRSTTPPPGTHPVTQSPLLPHEGVLNVNMTGAPTKSVVAGLPVWVWFVGFGAVALVASLAAVGAVGRRDSDSKSGEETTSSSGASGSQGAQQRKGARTYVHDPQAAGTCGICKRFKPGTWNTRLQGVHEGMQQSIVQPLRILGTRCEHNGDDHIHHFTVENDFSAPSLSALSTVYARAKPRLPRNTRIHIVKGDVHL